MRGFTGKVNAAADRCLNRWVVISVGKTLSSQLQYPLHDFALDSTGKYVLVQANARGGDIPAAM
jgi:phenylpropionate dioxygenase-like ring-hydroxylating dioxygenase large terminal subunit